MSTAHRVLPLPRSLGYSLGNLPTGTIRLVLKANAPVVVVRDNELCAATVLKVMDRSMYLVGMSCIKVFGFSLL